jgi:hypothetical protein
VTVASIPLVRRYLLFRLSLPGWPALVAWLVVPVAFGWFGFALLDSVQNFAPQEIRLSAEGKYDPYLDDFVVFYGAGALVAEGGASDLYQPESIREIEASELDVPADSIIQLPYFNPPPYVLPLVALSALPMAAAAVVWIATQLLAFACALAALWLKEGHSTRLTTAALFVMGVVASMPFHETVLHGQASLFFVAAWVALWFGAFERRNDGLLVFALTVMVAKPQLALIPIAYLVLTHRWRALALATVVQALLAILAMLTLGPLVYLRWLELLLQATGWEDQNGIWVHAMFGWNAFLRGLVGEGHHILRSLLVVGLTAATIAWCAARAHKLRASHRQPELFAMLVFASVLVSPHLFAQDLILPAAPLMLLALRRGGAERAIWLGAGSVGWLLTFFHFDLMGSPDDSRLNWVTLWLFAGVLISGLLAARPIDAREHRRSPARSGRPSLALQLGLASVFALALLATLPGFAGQKMANAIEYSYTAAKGPTYRIVIIGLASE